MMVISVTVASLSGARCLANIVRYGVTGERGLLTWVGLHGGLAGLNLSFAIMGST
jgi:hypothetical protein